MNDAPTLFQLEEPTLTLPSVIQPNGWEPCESLEDVPVIKCALGWGGRNYLLLPPWDMRLLAAAYAAADWRWSLTTEDRKRFWEHRIKPTSATEAWYQETMAGVLPTVERLTKAVLENVAECQRGVEWINGGGLTVFVSRSGKIGLGVDEVVGAHYKRMKEAGMSVPEPTESKKGCGGA